MALMKISTVAVECLLEGVACAIVIHATGKKPKKAMFKK